MYTEFSTTASLEEPREKKLSTQTFLSIPQAKRL